MAMTKEPLSPPYGGASLTVCIATFRRKSQLSLLLGDLLGQTHPPQQIVVVDNDPAGSAREVVEGVRASASPIEVVYDVQPEKNISLTRNRTVSHARGVWIASIDDDERAPERWLEHLMNSAHQFDADGVLGPVQPELPPAAPAWMGKSKLYAPPVMKTGSVVPLNALRLGNALLRTAKLRDMHPVFDPKFGVTGGEDGDLLMRFAQAGGKIVWSQDAVVIEPVDPARLRMAWVMRRAFRGGQDFAIHFHEGKLGRASAPRKLLFHSRATVQLGLAALFALATLPLGRHHAAYWVARACGNLGKLTTLWGGHYREYA